MDLLYLKIQINNFHLIFSVNYVKKLVMKHVIVNAISLLAMNAKKFYAIIEHANDSNLHNTNQIFNNDNFSNHNESIMNGTVVHPNISMNKSAAVIQDESISYSPKKSTILRNSVHVVIDILIKLNF